MAGSDLWGGCPLIWWWWWWLWCSMESLENDNPDGPLAPQAKTRPRSVQATTCEAPALTWIRPSFRTSIGNATSDGQCASVTLGPNPNIPSSLEPNEKHRPKDVVTNEHRRAKDTDSGYSPSIKRLEACASSLLDWDSDATNDGTGTTLTGTTDEEDGDRTAGLGMEQPKAPKVALPHVYNSMSPELRWTNADECSADACTSKMPRGGREGAAACAAAEEEDLRRGASLWL